MNTYYTSTNIAPLVSLGTYEGWLTSMLDSQRQMERESGMIVCDDTDFSTIGEALVISANEMFKEVELFKDLGVRSIKATKFCMPRYYNYKREWLELKFKVEDCFFVKAEEIIFDPKNRETVKSYIENCWCSRDGFISSMPCRISNGKWGQPGERYEDANPEELHDIFRYFRGEITLSETSEYLWFGGIIALLNEINLTEDYSVNLTCKLQDIFETKYSVRDFCTVLDIGTAEILYPKVEELIELVDNAEKDIKEDLEKYLEYDVPEDSKERTKQEVDNRLKYFSKFRKDIYAAIENNHPNKAEVDSYLSDLEDKWIKKFGETISIKAR